jgi:hypothetical protein
MKFPQVPPLALHMCARELQLCALQYTYYSVGGYGTSTPNYWKIQQYSSNGQLSGCTDSNEFCYTCEPPAQNDTMNDFGMFPEPAFSPTWQQSIQYIQANAGGSNAPVWDITMVPNETWTDPKTGIAVIVPGSDFWYRSQRDPYQDLVYLAKDLGLDGVDVDYEEMWHADYYKYGTGPWTLPQTVYKYAAVLYDIILNIKVRYDRFQNEISTHKSPDIHSLFHHSLLASKALRP